MALRRLAPVARRAVPLTLRGAAAQRSKRATCAVPLHSTGLAQLTPEAIALPAWIDDGSGRVNRGQECLDVAVLDNVGGCAFAFDVGSQLR